MARVLVLSPHPDDEALGCGGTLCAHVAHKDDVRIVFLTSGEAGGHGRDPEVTARMREKEAADAAAILGIAEIEFWREPDGALRVTPALTSRLRTLLDEWRPEVVYTTHEAEEHADHRVAPQLVRTALRTLKAPPPQVFLFEIWTPLQRLDRIVDITRWMPVKLGAVRAYRSQCAAMRFDEAVAGLNRYRGEMHSWPEGEYAEVFSEMKR